MEANGEGGGEEHGCGWMYEYLEKRAPGQLAGGGSWIRWRLVSKKAFRDFLLRSVLAKQAHGPRDIHPPERSRDVYLTLQMFPSHFKY